VPDERVQKRVALLLGRRRRQRREGGFAASRVDAFEFHHHHVLVQLERHERGHGYLLVSALRGREVVGASLQAPLRVLGIRRVELLGRHVLRHDLHHARLHVLALGAAVAAPGSAAGAGAVGIHGVVHAATHAQADRLHELLLAEVRAPGAALRLHLLKSLELLHYRIDILIVVRVPHVHRRVGLHRLSPLARHRGSADTGRTRARPRAEH
jgi:hypothetical protein